MAFGNYTKLFARPKKAFDKPRIEGENQLVKKYGLKNKREIWKAESEISKIRRQAKNLITADREKQNVLIKRLQNMGFKVVEISEVLALTKEDWLKRRLQSIVFEKKYASTAKGARQLITHKHIKIDRKIINIPSYIVPIEKEGKIEVLIKLKSKKQKEEKVVEKHAEEKKEESIEETKAKVGGVKNG